MQPQEHPPPLPVLPKIPSPCDGAALCLSIQVGSGLDLDPGRGIYNLVLIATGYKQQPRLQSGCLEPSPLAAAGLLCALAK